VKTSVKLRSDFARNDTEIWSIHSVGNHATSDEYVFNDVKKQAAIKSNSEGKDCFVVDSDRISPREMKTTRTMHGNSSNGSSFSYEVPTETYYSLPQASLYVSFHNFNECKNLEKTEKKVFYNNETIKNAKSVENGELMKEILIWGLSIGLVALIMVPIM
jgi:hypothetical protein